VLPGIERLLLSPRATWRTLVSLGEAPTSSRIARRIDLPGSQHTSSEPVNESSQGRRPPCTLPTPSPLLVPPPPPPPPPPPLLILLLLPARLLSPMPLLAVLLGAEGLASKRRACWPCGLDTYGSSTVQRPTAFAA
jgi:hypothetical protein